MKLFRFSPIQNENELQNAITHIHIVCHALCKQSFGKYLPVAGNIAIFCHYDDEFSFLSKLQESLTDHTKAIFNKYYQLHSPIVIPPQGNIPETTYTHLYIRKPDPYRSHVGDMDFLLDQASYIKQKHILLGGIGIRGARVFPRTDVDMIELFDADADALGYVRTVTEATIE